MFKNIKISIVEQDKKFEKVKLVQPNMIYNRFDIKYSGCFEVLEIEYKNKLQYIAIHINNKNICYIGIYMTELEQVVFDKILKFLTKNFKNIKHFHITQSLIDHPELSQKMHWLLELPNTIEEYNSQFSSKTRYNRRSKLKKLHEENSVEFSYYSKKEIDTNFINLFMSFKQQTKNNVYYDLSDVESQLYHVTDAYVLKINGVIQAMALYSITSDKEAYLENLAYDINYSSYHIGNLVYYHGIEKLIERGFKRIYLGGGDYDYKRNSKAIQSLTKSGNISPENSSLLKKIFEIKKTKTHKIIKIIGIKIKFKKQYSYFKFFKKCFIKFLNKNIKGENNKIIYINDNIEMEFKFNKMKTPLKIEGNNNLIILTGKINKKNLYDSLSGLNLIIEGNNNTVKLEFPIQFQNTTICMTNDNNLFSIKKTRHPIRQATFFIEGNNEVIIGQNSQLKNRGLYVVLNGNYKKRHKLVLGDNVYIAKDALIRTSDGHTLIDLNTNEPLSEPEDIIIGNNVWITSKCTILKGTVLPDNCIVGACSLVNKKFIENNTLIAGTPAKIIRKNVTWSKYDYGEYMRNIKEKEITNETL